MLGGDALDDTLGVLAGLQFALEDAGLPKGSSVFLTVYVASFASPFVVTRYMRRRYAVCELRLDGLAQRGAGMTYVARVPAARVARYTQTPFGYEIEVRGRNRLLAFLLPILVPADSDELRARVEPVLVSFYQGAEPPEATAGRTGA